MCRFATIAARDNDEHTQHIRRVEKARDQAAKELERLDAALSALSGARYRAGAVRLSAAARARIAAAQRARWAKVKAKNGKSNIVAMPSKRVMSAAARKKIAAA